MPGQLESTEIQETAEEITRVLKAAFDNLIRRRDTAFAVASAPLDAEIAALQQEHAAIGTAARNLAEVLPAKSRVAQAEADKLTVAGKHEAAAVKLTEAEEARNEPARMSARQNEISARIAAIASEKQGIARGIFEGWFAECQAVVRAAERGLFCTLLDGLRASFYEFQERTDTGGTLEKPYSFLIKESHLSNLTAPERSEEWNSGSRWYSGRR